MSKNADNGIIVHTITNVNDNVLSSITILTPIHTILNFQFKFNSKILCACIIIKVHAGP